MPPSRASEYMTQFLDRMVNVHREHDRKRSRRNNAFFLTCILTDLLTTINFFPSAYKRYV